MIEEKVSKLIQPRWAILIDCIWLILWSTIILKLDGNYPDDYKVWFAIVTIAGLLMPWCFVDGKYFK